MSKRLIEIVEQIGRRQRVVLVGDLMLDRYMYGNAERLSPEAPVPVLHYQREACTTGGAGNVAADLAVLGAEVRVVGVVGRDSAALEVKQKLSEYGCDTSYVIEDESRPTITKIRLIGLAQHRHPQQMMRVDFEDTAPLAASLAARVIDTVARALDGAAALCLEDYNKGLLTPEVCQRIIEMCRARRVPVLVDPAAIGDYAKYRGATVITPNATETEKATGMTVRAPEQYQPAAERLLQQLDLEAVALTLDKHGAYLATRDGERRWLKTRERRVYDVTGAGDMVLAMLACARAAGATWQEAVALANVAGGLEVEKFGVVPITRQEVIQELLTESNQHKGKQRTLEQLRTELEHHRAAGRKIVFTNGCYDLIHLGHIQYFRFAKAQGDLLVVGVNSDASVRRLKGEKRPIINQEDRLNVLEELECIDFLVCFEEDTPLRLIQTLQPDVLVKGADYRKDQVVGADVVEARGGRVALAPLIDGHSTSTVIQRILEAYRTEPPR